MQKLQLLLLTFIIAAGIQAQEGTSYNFSFNHIALSVKDVNRSAEFYKNVLKLPEITNRSQLDGVRWISLSEGKELHLIATIKQKVTTNKAVHLALTTTQFDEFITRLDQLKIAYSDWPGMK